MDDRHKMRASDSDRQEVVVRLRAALDDGRLKMPEYLDRMGLAYEAVTYGDLAPLYADLPEAGSMLERDAAPPATAPQAVAAPPGVFADLPAALKVLWTIWLAAVSINVVVLDSGQWHHWPPDLPLAGLGCRSVRGRAVRRVGWRHPDQAQPPVRRATPAGREGLIQLSNASGTDVAAVERERSPPARARRPATQLPPRKRHGKRTFRPQGRRFRGEEPVTYPRWSALSACMK